MPAFFKIRIPLLVILILFVACKIPYLHYAYYWDESWPYAVAVKAMYQHGVSLMPNAIDAELSRGHPLFFHAIAAMWMNVFGYSHISMHSFALFISVLFLIAIYEAGVRLFSKRAAVLALLLVASNEMFFVQSAMLLFEVLVAFWGFLSIVFYVKGKYFFTTLCLAMLFYTKESGLIMGFVLGVDAIISLFKKNVAWKEKLYRLASVGVPCIMITFFFLVQKHTRGWYVFPLYSGFIQTDWNKFWYAFRMLCVKAEFYDSLVFYYFLLLMLIAIIAAIKQKDPKFLVVLLPATCIYYFIDDMRAGRLLPGIPFFIVFVLSAIVFLYVYSAKKYYPELYQRKLIVLTGLFVLCFLCFSSMNFFTPRYLLASMIPLFFLTAIFLDTLIKQTYAWLYYPVIIVILAISGAAYITDDNCGDTNIGAYNGIAVHQGIVDFFEQHVPPDVKITTGLFLEQQHLSNPATGFLHSGKAFKNFQWEIDSNTQYAVFDNIEGDGRYNDFKKDSSFRLVYRIEKGKVWGEVYQRK